MCTAARIILACRLGLLVSLVSVSPVAAVIVGGGGSSRTDCLAVFDAGANLPPDNPKQIRCTDGDPACDQDGVVNGQCEFRVAVCANSTYRPDRCTLAGVDEITVEHAADNGDPKFDTEFQSLQSRIDNMIGPPTSDPDVCTTPTPIRVVLQGPFPGGVCKKAKKEVALTAESEFILGKQYRDKDKLKMTCDPAPSGCDPALIFTGTFDRIQSQIFNRSCALSGCHDSQTQAANLLLEQGTAYGNIVDVFPSTLAAAGLGWRRIDATNANPDTSFLFHKITGDLDAADGLGERMPFKRRKLDQFLIDIVALWIADGAPATGWTPGTDN